MDTFFTGHLKAVEQSAQEALVIDFMHELRGQPTGQRSSRYDEVMAAMAVRQALIHLPYWGSGWLIPIPASFSAGRLYQ